MVPMEVLPSPQWMVALKSPAVAPESASMKIATTPVNATLCVACSVVPHGGERGIGHRDRSGNYRFASAPVMDGNRDAVRTLLGVCVRPSYLEAAALGRSNGPA